MPQVIAFIIMMIISYQFEFMRPFFYFGCALIAVILAIVLIMGLIESEKAKSKKVKHLAALDGAERTIEGIVTEHLSTLAKRHSTLVRVDRYGVVEAKEWNREVQHFVDKVVRPKLTTEEAQAVADEGMNSVFQRLIEDRVVDYCNARSDDGISEVATPLEFEAKCAAILRSNGWLASITKASGDQGADVFAQKGDRKLVVQCKYYTGSTGNKAVQEVVAAKSFYDAQIGAVVSTSEFTKSAKELAASSGVHLFDLGDLEKFAST